MASLGASSALSKLTAALWCQFSHWCHMEGAFHLKGEKPIEQKPLDEVTQLTEEVRAETLPL